MLLDDGPAFGIRQSRISTNSGCGCGRWMVVARVALLILDRFLYYFIHCVT